MELDDPLWARLLTLSRLEDDPRRRAALERNLTELLPPLDLPTPGRRGTEGRPPVSMDTLRPDTLALSLDRAQLLCAASRADDETILVPGTLL